MAATRGTQFLEQLGIPFAPRPYPHAQKGALFAAAALGRPPEVVAKTLVVAIDADFAFAVLPGTVELSPKKLARAHGGKAATMATPRDAERLTGYLTGGISPFGSRRALPVYVHESLLAGATILVNAGQRGLLVELAPADLVAVLDATVVDLAATAS